MDMSRYKELKDKNAIKLQRLARNTFQMLTPQFDQYNGEELAPIVTQCTPAGVDQAIIQLQEKLDIENKAMESLKMLQEDMKTLEANKATVS